jgi:NAD(P)-dependent dehydrogenase (short-subunit alcohol dehydrogenase family)
VRDDAVTGAVLEGKVVMMTGAAQGMGREMSLGIAAAGGKVVLVDIDEMLLQETAADVESAGGQGAALPVVCDVSSQAAAQQALAQALDRYGRIDVLVNDAVIGPENVGSGFMANPRKFWELDDDLWNAQLRVNIYGPQLMAKTVVGQMIDNGWGRIINVTTSLDTMYRYGLGAYGPTKAALEAHTVIMAHDLEGTGVTANVLIPGGPVATRMFPDDAGVEVDKLIRPTVMVDPIVWLCSGQADGINSMRFRAAMWKDGLDRETLVERTGAPAAWTQLGAQAIYPDD